MDFQANVPTLQAESKTPVTRLVFAGISSLFLMVTSVFLSTVFSTPPRFMIRILLGMADMKGLHFRNIRVEQILLFFFILALFCFGIAMLLSVFSKNGNPGSKVSAVALFIVSLISSAVLVWLMINFRLIFSELKYGLDGTRAVAAIGPIMYLLLALGAIGYIVSVIINKKSIPVTVTGILSGILFLILVVASPTTFDHFSPANYYVVLAPICFLLFAIFLFVTAAAKNPTAPAIPCNEEQSPYR